ncbi:hypothetical protein CR513_09218, partial [Mucuna pruriens]
MHSKDEVLDKFKIFKSQLELQHKSSIKHITSDRGGEMYNPSFFESVGIIHQITPYFLQQNDITKRKKIGEIVQIHEPNREKLGEKEIGCARLEIAKLRDLGL